MNNCNHPYTAAEDQSRLWACEQSISCWYQPPTHSSASLVYQPPTHSSTSLVVISLLLRAVQACHDQPATQSRASLVVISLLPRAVQACHDQSPGHSSARLSWSVPTRRAVHLLSGTACIFLPRILELNELMHEGVLCRCSLG